MRRAATVAAALATALVYDPSLMWAFLALAGVLLVRWVEMGGRRGQLTTRGPC